MGKGIPNRDRAFIAEKKVRDYLLSSVYPIGRHKARFFFRLGYCQESWNDLAMDLEQVLLESPVVNCVQTHYGEKYIVEGRLKGPVGKTAKVVTVWVIKTGEDFPRLVTAYPGV